MKNRPLAKALHTVTAVAHVAILIRQGFSATGQPDPERVTRLALNALGYHNDQIDAGDPALFAACVAAVAKQHAAPLALVA